jgi:Dolichyl-phosphate-mannose-protein mannosyltransferase
MEDLLAPARSSLTRTLRWSWALVVACGLLLGYYIVQAYVSPKQRQYQLNFGDAKWIEPQDVAPVAYFRREVFLSSIPEEAWVEIAATDNYKIFVNGHTVGSKLDVKTRVAGIYDIKKHLKVGTNVIAVSISRISYPGPAQLLVCGHIKEPGGRITSLLSDDKWRVATYTGIVAGSEDWTSPVVEQAVWPNARLAKIKKRVPIAWVDMNPLLLQLPVTGSWIMADDAGPETVFSTSVNADWSRQETWIQVAAAGDIDLLVNGHVVISATPAPVGGRQLPHMPPPIPPSVLQAEEGVATGSVKSTEAPGKPILSRLQPPDLLAYDISYWIKKGSNAIVATVRTDHPPASLFADGFLVRGNGKITRFETNSHWRIGDRTLGKHLARSQRAVELGKNGVAPWGYLPQDLARPIDRSSFATLARSCIAILLTTGAIVSVWLLVSALLVRLREEPLSGAMACDALLHGPIAVGLVLLLLPNYDLRFPTEWSFQPKFVISAILALLAVRLWHLWPRDRKASDLMTWVTRLRQTDFRPALPYLLLAVIMGLGLGLRYHNLGYMSFDHDEMGLVTKSKGIFKLGIPYTLLAGEVRWITTYEAVPYPLALSGWIFGYSEWSMRLPACIMGTLSIGLIAVMGRRLFNWRTGLFAALVYACMPLNIRWAQNAFYLTQCQFMALLTIWLFYEAIRARPLRHGFLTAASVAFCATYLSWEGTGFLLPALFLALVIVRWGEWWWLKEFHLYRCLFFIGALVVAQYCSRTIAVSTYLIVGSGVKDLTGPSLFFLNSAYQPMFYVDHLWLAENHVFFTVMILLGLPFCWAQRGFRYVFTVLVALFLCHTNLLAALSPRYCYYFQPLVILCGTAAAITLYDRIASMARRGIQSMPPRIAAHVTGLAVMTLLFIQSNESLMKDYVLSANGDHPGLMTRMNTYRYDYRGAAEYVKGHLQPGDVILPGIPHVFAYYAGMPGDYFLDTLLSSRVPYDQLLDQPRYVDKFAGLPVVRNLAELEEVVARARRTWVVFAPYASFEKLTNQNVLDYLNDTAKVEFETYRAKVLLVQRGNQPKSVAKEP